MDINKLISQIKSEFRDVSSKLSSLDISSNKSEYAQLALRHSQLSQIAQSIERYENIENQLIQVMTMLKEEADSNIQQMAQEEKTTLEVESAQILKEILDQMKHSDPDDLRNAIMEIRAGTGGEEAALFAKDLYRMYSLYCERNGYIISPISSHFSPNGGLKEIIFLIKGKNSFGRFKYESGVHRVQRVPVTESAGRIHTSAVSVVVLPEVDDVNIAINDEDIRIDVYRSGGPGGQSVNTTDSAVRITHIPTGIVVTCQDEKSQHKNKARAMSVLKSKLYNIEIEKQQSSKSNIRKQAIGAGDRSDKIRTFNYPQSRITDHRIKQSWFNLNSILDGDIGEILDETKEKLSSTEE